MNKTLTINISGIIFYIEIDAYEKLDNYLTAIKSYFKHTEGGSEILGDIESRIAEMLQGKISVSKQVIIMADVEFVIATMGNPKDIAGDENANESNTEYFENQYQSYDTAKKRLYRDGDSKVLGGVCSGIGHYFGIDPVWLRIALLLLFFFAGSGFLIYLILWIAIPEAKTRAEKLGMKGEPVDINNISKKVKEEAEQFKVRMEKYGQEFKDMAGKNKDVPKNTVDKIVVFVTEVLMNIGKVFLKIFGIALIVLGVILFISLFSSVFGISYTAINLEGKEFIDLMLLDGKDLYLGLIGISVFVGIPVIMMIYSGIKLLFRIHYSNRWLNLTTGILWLSGLSLLLYVAVKTGLDFSQEAKNRTKTELMPYSQLTISAQELVINYGEPLDEDEDFNQEKKNKFGDYSIGELLGKKYIFGTPKVNIIKSQSNQVELIIMKEANGGTEKMSYHRAESIDYDVLQKDSLVYFNNVFKFDLKDKFRMQKVKAILKIPVNQIIFIDYSMKHLLFDVDNLSDTFDEEMVNRKWMMTEQGLKCLDCEGI
jgi:phage shock protein PspC (stress-responsive transcriptional regulator)